MAIHFQLEALADMALSAHCLTLALTTHLFTLLFVSAHPAAAAAGDASAAVTVCCYLSATRESGGA